MFNGIRTPAPVQAHWNFALIRREPDTVPEPTPKTEAPSHTSQQVYRTYDLRSARSYMSVLPLLVKPKTAGLPEEKRGRTVRRHGAERYPAPAIPLQPALTEQDDEAFLAHLAGELEASESPENTPTY